MRASTASRAVSISTGTDGPCTPDLAADRQSIAQRQHHIEDDGVVVGDRRLIHGLVAVADDIDGVGFLAESLREHLRRPRLIFDEQNSHLASCYRHRR